METVLEGSLDDCLAAARAAHEACFSSGVQKGCHTSSKSPIQLNGSTIDDKLAKYQRG